ncbi:hypothetical protein CXIVA_24850 [Clostridium sp. SY8519]|nr:hypothetical protein CXIVA_24850 [Clostridium sp. SY8519]
MYEYECLTQEEMEADIESEECSPFMGECYPVACNPGSCFPA